MNCEHFTSRFYKGSGAAFAFDRLNAVGIKLPTNAECLSFPQFIKGEMQKLLSTDILSQTQRQNIFADNTNRLFLKGV